MSTPPTAFPPLSLSLDEPRSDLPFKVDPTTGMTLPTPTKQSRDYLKMTVDAVLTAAVFVGFV